MHSEIESLQVELAKAKSRILELEIRLRNAELLYANELRQSSACSTGVAGNLAGHVSDRLSEYGT